MEELNTVVSDVKLQKIVDKLRAIKDRHPPFPVARRRLIF